jgi:anaphase-promoting complex subunit 10
MIRSDGPQPHLVSIQFPKKMPVTVGREPETRRVLERKSEKVPPQEVTMYLDYKQDESYTPQRISIRAGTCYQDLQVRSFRETGC